MNEELLSGIKVLVALAQADGTIHADERHAIESALDGVDLPEGTTAAALLEAVIDLDAELARITTEAVRTRTYDAACAIVYVDGEFSPEEREMLARVATAFGVKDADPGRFQGFKSAVPAPTVAKEEDPTKRDALIQGEIQRAAELAGALAGTELPIAAESCLVTNNVRLARNIGLAYGTDADEAFWRTFVGNVLGAEGSWFAVTTLLKLLPGFSTTGPIAAYATTVALGGATRSYFAKGEDLDVEALRGAFKRAKKDALTAAKDARPAILARLERLAKEKAPLDAKLAKAELTETAYADALAALGAGDV